MTRDYTALDATITALGLTYAAEFVPFSRSRGAKPAPALRDMTVNWRVTISKGAHSLTTDYMQGIALLPEPLGSAVNGHVSVDFAQAITSACETGQYISMRNQIGRTFATRSPLPVPPFRSVLHALVSDADVLNSGGFEDWARDFGYNTDSRKAEAIYRACLEIALQLRALISDAELSTLREAFKDY